jgi:hypothetical protein
MDYISSNREMWHKKTEDEYVRTLAVRGSQCLGAPH